MCLAAFAINASSRWPLVLASNRDEFFDRPALPLTSWQTATGHALISGRDVLAGGTWLGVTPGGRVALLTNVREPVVAKAPRSRGELTVRWLEGIDNAHRFVAGIDGALYGGFNLVMGDLTTGQWHSWSNRPDGARARGAQRLDDGIYGLSNAALDTPWPKTLALKAAMVDALALNSKQSLEKALFTALSNQERAAIDQLPQTSVPPELEWALSSARVNIAERNYGTRCASVLVIEASNKTSSAHNVDCTASLTEITYPALPATDPANHTTAQHTFNLSLKAAGWMG